MIPTKRAAPPQSRSIQPPDSIDNSTPRAKRIGCRSHCSCCDRCFASDEAFDQHRRGKFSAAEGTFEGRHCVAPDILGKYEPHLGFCSISSAAERPGRSVWRLSRAAARARATFAKGGPEIAEPAVIAPGAVAA